jgi:hypothetical protein
MVDVWGGINGDTIHWHTDKSSTYEFDDDKAYKIGKNKVWFFNDQRKAISVNKIKTTQKKQKSFRVKLSEFFGRIEV